MRSKTAIAILQSARVAELKRAAALLQPRQPMPLPRDMKRRNAWLLALIAAERRRSAALIEQLR
jgi:hypothetical protein